MQRLNNLILLLVLVGFSYSGLWAQSSDAYAVNFRYGTQQFEANAAEFSSRMQLQSNEIYNGKFYRFVQFYQIPTQVQKKNMEAMGIEFLEYIPNNVYLAAIPTAFNFSTWSALGIRSLQPVGLGQKLDQRLEERPLPVWAMIGSQQVRVFVQLYPNISAAQAHKALMDAGYTIIEVDNFSKTLITRVNLNDLEALAKMPFIRYVDLPSQPGVPESDDGRNLHRANLIDRDYFGSNAFRGTGVAVAINDDGPVGPHIDFTGRTNQQTAGTGTGTHGDMTVGIVGAAGNLDPTMRGMAVGAYLHVRAYDSNLPGTLDLHQDSAVLIFSSSYSNGCNAGYTTLTRTVDQEIYNNTSLIQVFSAGNSNGLDCDYGAGTQWGNITGGHKIGKNVIATANLRSNDEIETSSSRGPANDGRIKPDISAHGTNHWSTDPDNEYAPGGGTSAACPGISGVMAQLHEAYRSMNAGATAPSALLKACMLNTTNDLGNDGPDFIFGWGKVNAYRALLTLQENRYLTAAISQGGANTHNVTIPANVKRARLMVYWHDKEASTAAATALVNNLNMTVTEGGNTYHPWILNSAANAATLALPATRTGTVDNLNNVEQVAIDNPTAGTYTVNIAAPTVPFGPQTYYLVWEFLTDDVMVTFPVGGEGLIPGAADRIHWDAYGTTGTFDIEVSTDNGVVWTTVQSGVNAANRFIAWTVPNTVTGQARVRITRGTFSDESDANFSIINQPQNIQVVAICTTASTIRLTWDPVTGATGYDIFKLGQKYMDSVGSSVATVFDVPVPNINASYWFAVRAKGTNNLVGLRSIAVEHTGGGGTGANCLLDCGANDDAGVAGIISPSSNLQSCTGNNFDVTIELTNISTTTQTNFPVYYQLGAGTPVMETYAGTLVGGTSANFTFTNQLNLTIPGAYILKVWTALSGDGARCNDTLEIPINFSNPIGIFPYAEDFEAATFPPNNSYLINPDNGITWVQSGNITGSSGATTKAMRLNFYSYNAPGEEDVFGLVSMDLTSAAAAQLSFDVAHAQYSGTYTDGLRVMVSTDCGQTFSQAYFKQGAALATVPPTTTTFSPTSATQWRNEVIDLTPYAGNHVAFRFIGLTDFGNDLYVDNINIQTINSMPVAAFTANNLTTCNGNVSFSDMSTNTPTAWAWNFGDGNSSTQQNPTHTYTASGTYTVSMIASNILGNDTITQTNYITVNFPVAPTTNTNISACVGQTLTLTANSASSTLWWYDASGNFLFDGNSYTTPALTGAVNYQVRSATANAVSNVGPLNSATVGGGGFYNATAYLNFSTTAATRIVSVWVNNQTAGSRTITVYDAVNGGGNIVDQVTVNVPVGPIRLTLNLEIPLAGTYSIGSSNLYRNNAGPTYPYTNGLVSITGSSAGTGFYYFFYDWEVEHLNLCLSNPVTVNVNVAEANFANNATAASLSVDFTDQSIGATSWLWNFGDGNTATQQNPTHVYATAGSYTVSLTINGVCSVQTTINIGPVAVADVEDKHFSATILPNPTSSQAILTLKSPLDEDMMIELLSVDGRVLREMYLGAGATTLSIDCAQLVPAMYFIRMKTNTITDTRKLVVKR